MDNDATKPAKWTSRWFLMSVLLSTGAFVLAWVLEDPAPFTAIGTVALGGGHATNVMERRQAPTQGEQPEGK